VTLRARWVTLRARWVTLRARWVTLRARWVTSRCCYAAVPGPTARPRVSGDPRLCGDRRVARVAEGGGGGGAAGYTALMRAAVEGHVEVMDLLVSAGARPMFESLSGRTALIEASRVGQLHAVVHLLGKLHVNPRQLNFLNRPPMPLHRFFYTGMTADRWGFGRCRISLPVTIQRDKGRGRVGIQAQAHCI
jgi:hypothetical protein